MGERSRERDQARKPLERYVQEAAASGGGLSQRPSKRLSSEALKDLSLAKLLEGSWTVPGRFLDGSWTVPGRFLELF